MPKIEYITKKFRVDSLNLIEKINGVINDYNEQGYSLTLRQVYYQMVARDIIPNNEKSYKNLGSLISDARLAGLIDWKAIEDRTRNLRSNAHWETPREIIRTASSQYQLDHWENQINYVEVWVEKDALVGIVGQICKKLDVNYFSCRGYVSQSEMWEAADRLKTRAEEGKNLILLHLGDHDPSGKDMSRDIRDRLELFDVEYLKFNRLALNMEQIEQYNPPPNPTKLTDSRAYAYIEKFGHSCWELDALEPKTISDLIIKNVLKYRDEIEYSKIKEKEDIDKKTLKKISNNWDKVKSFIEKGDN